MSLNVQSPGFVSKLLRYFGVKVSGASARLSLATQVYAAVDAEVLIDPPQIVQGSANVTAAGNNLVLDFASEDDSKYKGKTVAVYGVHVAKSSGTFDLRGFTFGDQSATTLFYGGFDFARVMSGNISAGFILTRPLVAVEPKVFAVCEAFTALGPVVVTLYVRVLN